MQAHHITAINREIPAKFPQIRQWRTSLNRICYTEDVAKSGKAFYQKLLKKHLGKEENILFIRYDIYFIISNASIGNLNIDKTGKVSGYHINDCNYLISEARIKDTLN